MTCDPSDLFAAHPYPTPTPTPARVRAARFWTVAKSFILLPLHAHGKEHWTRKKQSQIWSSSTSVRSIVLAHPEPLRICKSGS